MTSLGLPEREPHFGLTAKWTGGIASASSGTTAANTADAEASKKHKRRVISLKKLVLAQLFHFQIPSYLFSEVHKALLSSTSIGLTNPHNQWGVRTNLSACSPFFYPQYHRVLLSAGLQWPPLVKKDTCMVTPRLPLHFDRSS